jgi:trans-2,3-dihydro-3-hydroxyanthranilate isomerase
MNPRFVLCDVFAEAPGEGNQLCVFPDGVGLPEEFLQKAAHEINFSETTFMFPPESSDDDLLLRIFTPAQELPFAGHPIVGSAVVAAVRKMTSGRDNVVRFATGVGQVPVEVELDSDRHGRAEMRQPLPKFLEESRFSADVHEAAQALGIEPSNIPIGPSPIALVDNGLPVLIVPVDSLASMRSVQPSAKKLRALCRRMRALTCCAFTTETLDPGSHVHCRIFAPGAGVLEDPATGSANGPLGAYLVTHGLRDEGLLVSEQGVEMGRPSRLSITVQRDAEGEMADVRVAGGVYIVGEGEFFPW